MSRARQLILENDTDFIKDEVLGAADDIEWQDAARDIMDDARQLYLRLRQQGVIDLLKKHVRKGSIVTAFDEDAIAQAVLQLALERRGGYSKHDNAYKLIRKWATL